MTTQQEQFWQGQFGADYTERNNYDPAAFDAFYQQIYGVARSTMNDEFLSPISPPKKGEIKEGVSKEQWNILEVGCNVGNQLNLLQQQGYKNLYGIEIMEYAVERAKQLTKGINIVQGSAFDLPFKNNYFDLVFTSGVLIHIHPDDVKKAMAEIVRVSKKYIWGFEYFAETLTEIKYRDHQDRLWKTNFSNLYLDLFPVLALVKEKKYPYAANARQVDAMFLLEKSSTSP
ncbi:methyltransferase type 11 [Candidatus Uhrbacteria bacterium RIFCSPLOWO2_02_FULL_49_11]|uniref:Methyltransferase type 11 n=1 Tax=Candidatus Uhrbacteria bacterium RIFCSPLOWO2_02_FULL_49_11 TaxID=1802409 RepID=A0A1F7VDQ3_9BACT|nr:MAG: methyltransferase type 11 [Candidatus Uhrbacteria bacterium RIFCSPLOWO2_02_FULL_49_11]